MDKQYYGIAVNLTRISSLLLRQCVVSCMTRKRRTEEDDDPRVKFWELFFGKLHESEWSEDLQRTNVMTRVRSDVVEVLDALIELGAFNSRSEAVSVYIEQAILSHSKLYEKLKTRAQEMGRVRESAVDLVKDFYRDDSQ